VKRNTKLIKLTSIFLILILAMAAFSGCGSSGGGSEAEGEATGALTFEDAPIQWTMQSIWVPSITLWRGDKYFVDLINRQALGELYIEYNEGGALVTTSDEVFDAVRTGSIDMATDWPSYWEGRDTAFGLVTSTPMILTPGDYMIWYWQGGGLELVQKLYDEYNIVWYPHSVTSPESGQRTNVPIYELDDYAGLKLRQCGRVQAMILEQLGAGAVFMPGADIYLSLDRGVVDGAEFSVPECDWNMAFQEISKYSVVPGWHQPGPISGVMINKDSFAELPDHVKYLFKEAAMSSMMWAWTYFEYSSIGYQKNFSDAGIETSRLSDEALAQIQQIAWDVLIQDAKDNPNHAKLAYSQVRYLYGYQDWRAMQEPFTHGRNPEGLNEAYAALEQIAKDHGVYDEVIATEEDCIARAEAQVHWEPGTEYVQNPLAQ
jgi:TRAP-type mannitol/chloroaromatic compound transport system substrate-binding protein